MKSSKMRRQSLTALAGVIFLLLSGSSPATFGQDLQPSQGADQRRVAERVAFVDDPPPLSFTAVAQAVVDGMLALAPLRLWTSGANKVFVPWGSPPDLTAPFDCGIIVDDGVPF